MSFLLMTAKRAGGAAPAGAVPFFTENFAGGVFNNANGFVWEAAKSLVYVGTTQARSGTHSLEIKCGPNVDGVDGDQSTIENAFTLGRHCSTFAMEYYWFIPSNYTHKSNSRNATATFTAATPTEVTTSGGWDIAEAVRVKLTTTGTVPTGLTNNATYYWKRLTATTGKLAASFADVGAGIFLACSDTGSGTHTLSTVTSNNNKFIALFNDSYQTSSASGNWRVTLQTWATTTPGVSSRMDCIWSGTGALSIESDRYEPKVQVIGGASPWVVGDWNRVRIFVKRASAFDVADGVITVWANDTVVHHHRDVPLWNFYNADPAKAVGNALYAGKFFGSSNSGYTEETIFNFDEFKFYDTDPGWTVPLNISMASTNLTVARSGTVSTVVTIERNPSFTADVALTVNGLPSLPSGLSASFSPSTLSGGTLTSTLTFTATGAATIIANKNFRVNAVATGINDVYIASPLITVTA